MYGHRVGKQIDEGTFDAFFSNDVSYYNVLKGYVIIYERRRTEDGGPRTEDGGLKTEDGRRRTEDMTWIDNYDNYDNLKRVES
jgi:hypothetical protein